MEAASISNEVLPFGSPLIALFSLVPLYITLYRAKSYKACFWYMFFQAITVHLLSSFWLANFRDFAVFTLGASAVGTGWLAGQMGLFFHIMPAQQEKTYIIEENGGFHHFSQFSRILWFCACWICWEWFKSTGFLAYPWGTLFLGAYRWKILTQIADITGPWGISFLFALFAAFVGEGLMTLRDMPHAQAPQHVAMRYRQCAKFTAVLFALSAVYGLFQYFLPRVPEKSINTIIVQQNIDPWEGGEQQSITISQGLTEKAADFMRSHGQEPELVLWSEGVLEHPFPRDRSYYEIHPEEESLGSFIRRMHVPFIIGGTTVINPEKKHYANSAIFFDKAGMYAGFYSKIHLVPFAEAIPFADTPLMKLCMEKTVGFSSGYTSGNQYVLFKVPVDTSRYLSAPLEENRSPFATIPLNSFGMADPAVTEQFIQNHVPNPRNFVSFTTPICFEDAFPDVCRKLFLMGSEVFMNITNDSWSRTASAEYQHFVAASYLAIEYRTTLVRCANAGYSVVVDPAGHIIDDLPVFTADALCAKVPVYERHITFFARWGDWLIFLCFCCMGVYVLYAYVCLRFCMKNRA